MYLRFFANYLDIGQQRWPDTRMARSSLGQRPSMITMLLRGTRKQSRIFTLDLVSRVVAGDPPEPLGLLLSTDMTMVTAAPLLMMTLRIIELRLGRERAPIEDQMMTVQMMSRRLRRRHL